jgi:hypothetical protein
MSACEICGTSGSAEVKGRTLCADCALKVREYGERVERRAARWVRRADKAEAEYAHRHGTAKEMASWIPFGQPILVGHHSEKRDRAYRAKIERNFRKAFEALDKAHQLRIRARASERNRAISSDDPLAVVAMREKIAGAEKQQALMKAANWAIRRYAKEGLKAQVEALAVMGISETNAKLLIEPDYMGRLGFPDYAMKNNGANIRRMQERLKQLEARAKTVAALEAQGSAERVEQWGDTALIHSYADNRIRIVFPSKPTAEAIKLLKQWGFVWSPSNTAWQRMLNNAGIYSAKMVLQHLGKSLTPESGETPEPDGEVADLPAPTMQKGLFGEDKRVNVPALKTDTPQQKRLFELESGGGSGSGLADGWLKEAEGRLI